MVVTALRKNKKEQEKKPANDTTQQNISPDISFNTNQQNLPDTASQKNISTHVANEIAKNNSGDTASQTNKENKADLSMIQIGKTKKQNRVPEKLKWGLNFSAGSSIITQNRFSLKGGGNFDRGSYNAPGTVTGGGAGFVNAPASNRSSFGFKAGLALKKNLTKRSSLFLNINYNYLTDKIRIGNRQNGSPQANTSINVSSYYNTIPLKTFTDRFHFVGIPINYDWRITRNPKHFISLTVMKKTLFTAFCCFLLFSFQSCLKDKLTHTYTIFTPIYETKEAVSLNIKSNPPKDMQLPGKFFVYGNYIFLNEIDKGVHIIDNTDPANPVVKAFIDIPGNLDIAVKGNILYADMYQDLVAVDISDPLKAKLVKDLPDVFPERYYANGFIQFILLKINYSLGQWAACSFMIFHSLICR